MVMRVNAMMMTNAISRIQRAAKQGLAGVLVGLLAGSPTLLIAQQQAGSQVTTIKVQTNIVLTNVVVRDKKTGEVVKGLKPSDFTILEDNKPQKIASFDYENVDQAAVL